ncbi:MAG: hypothetical protein ACHQNT_05095 [Bacteroidia bacterium]
MTHFNHSLKKWFRTISFSLLLIAGCFINTNLAAQNRETNPRVNDDGTPGDDPVNQYIISHQSSALVMYHRQFPADDQVASMVKIQAIIDNPSAFGEYQVSDIEQMKSQLSKMRVGFLATLKQNPDAGSQDDGNITPEQARKTEIINLLIKDLAGQEENPAKVQEGITSPAIAPGRKQ